MNYCYYASFIPGMQEVISSIVRERFPGDPGESGQLSKAGRSPSPVLSIVKLLDGAIIFETDCPYDKLNFFCFNNIFAMIHIEQNNTSLDHHIKKICAAGKKSSQGSVLTERAWAVISENNKKIKTFRLTFSMENQPVQVSEGLRLEMEQLIAGNSNLKTDRTRPDTEFWFLSRSEGFSCFMKRLTVDRSVRRPGELSPQLAWLLCRMANLKYDETALDPFCGYGSIPNAGCKYFPVRKFYALDNDPKCIKITRSKNGLQTERSLIQRAEIHSIFDFIPQESVDAIITDPPWGMYKETDQPLQIFYDEMINIFSRLLKKGGRAIILSGAGKELVSAAEKAPELVVGKIIPVLVSGKKASVFVLTKNA